MSLQQSGSILKSGLKKIEDYFTTPGQGFQGGHSFNQSSAPIQPAKPIQQGNLQGMIQIPQTQKPTTPVKSTTIAHPSGTTITTNYHAPEKTDTTSAPKTSDSSLTTAEQSAPQVGTTLQNAQNVLNSGNQTPNESRFQTGILNAGQTTPDERAFQQQYVNSVRGKQFGALAPYAESSMYAGKSPEEIQGLINAPDLAGRSSADTGLYNQLGNAYGNAALAGLTAAQTSATRNLSANQSAYSGAQTQAGRATGTADTVLSASLPGQISGSTRTYNPLDPAGTTGTNDIIQGQNNQSIADLTTQYNDGLKTINQAKGIEAQIANTLLNNPDINNQPLSLLTNLNQYLSGQVGSAPQQQLAQQVSNYIKTLGLDPASVVNIANQKKGTLAQLLGSLRDTAISNNEAIKTTRDSLGSSSSSSNSSGSTTGGTSEGSVSAGGYNFKLVNGKYVPV